MRIEILGSGGAVSAPRPLCRCPICTQARTQGVPYSRSGPSLFVHGPDLLVDTPEDILSSLDRSPVASIAAGTYSHWHPDHVMGLRLWEALNGDWVHWPAHPQCTPLYFPQRVAADIRGKLGVWESFEFMQQRGLIEIIELADGESFQSNGYTITPLQLAEEYMYGFIIAGDKKRVLIVADELFGWQPRPELGHFDIVVLPMGVAEYNPLTGRRHYPQDHPVLVREATIEQTLDIARRLDARQIVLTHISEPEQLGYDDLLVLQEKLRREGLPITFAYDALIAEA
jgi:phosphoribosyl 1,2-cyclic phosphate phosphodiesterase